MRLTIQKQLAAKVLKCSKDRVWIDPERLADVKEAVTADDIHALINMGLIVKKQKTGVSRVRARQHILQKKRGRRTGQGSRKGKLNARQARKKTWMNTIRVQRKLLKNLKDKKIIETKVFHTLLKKAKGGLFRSQRHIKVYIKEQDLIKKAKTN